MNERVKELEKQSVFYNEDEEIWETDLEKFAELIVRECAKRSEELGQPEIGLGLMKHFGVPE